MNKIIAIVKFQSGSYLRSTAKFPLNEGRSKNVSIVHYSLSQKILERSSNILDILSRDCSFSTFTCFASKQ